MAKYILWCFLQANLAQLSIYLQYVLSFICRLVIITMLTSGDSYSLTQAADTTNSRLGFVAVKELRNTVSGILILSLHLLVHICSLIQQVLWYLTDVVIMQVNIFCFISVYMSMHFIPKYFTHIIILIHPCAMYLVPHSHQNLDLSIHVLPTIGLLYHSLTPWHLQENWFPIQSSKSKAISYSLYHKLRICGKFLKV